jgi:predicted DNA-binding antitoxin AbrB/MazE fold protein
MIVKAIYENGVFKPQEPVHLADRTEVEVSATIPIDADDQTGWKAAEALIGLIDYAPPDMAERHDQWLKI